MKNTKIKGFSLAEVLISLTVVSILLAVAAPVITKQHVGDSTWKWTEGNTVKNGTSFDGNNLVIGSRTVPSVDDVDDYFSSLPDGDIKTAAASDLFFNNDRLISKLSIIKPLKTQILPNMSTSLNSHLSFYNIVNGVTEYAGRLTSDKDNLALGIASLQSLNSGHGSDNTAIGHYALAYNNTGSNNVALGYGALANNESGSNNTAVGYRALSNSNSSNNVVIGNHYGDTVEQITGDNNLIIGNYFGDDSNRTWGEGNIFIGNNAGKGLPLDWGEPIPTPIPNDYKFENIIAIGNVNPASANAEERVELLQTKEDRNNDRLTYRKVVVNGDFVVRSANGRKVLFKVDGTNLHNADGSKKVISELGNGQSYLNSQDYRNNIASPTRDPQLLFGPPRCEGAEVCIGQFSVPFADCGLLRPTTNSIPAYDVYIKSMSVGAHHRNLKEIPYLRAALLYLDKFKDSKGSFINFLNKRARIFEQFFPGLSSSGFGEYLRSLVGLDSDARLKNIYGDSTAGLNEINALKVKDYTYKADKTKTPHVGVIAQELQKVFPNSVIEGSDGYLSITQEEMFFGLVNSIQELSDKNDNVSEKIALSKEQIEYTQKQNKLIEQENKLLERQNKEFAKRIAKLQKKKI